MGRSPGVLGLVLAVAGEERKRLRKFPFPAVAWEGSGFCCCFGLAASVAASLAVDPTATHVLERLACLLLGGKLFELVTSVARGGTTCRNRLLTHGIV